MVRAGISIWKYWKTFFIWLPPPCNFLVLLFCGVITLLEICPAGFVWNVHLKSSTVGPANHQKHLSSELTVPKSSRGKSGGLFSSLLQSTNATRSTCGTKSRPLSWPLSKHHYGLCYTILRINIKQCIYRYFNINIPEVIKLSVIKYSLAERVFIKSYLHLLPHGTTALT